MSIEAQVPATGPDIPARQPPRFTWRFLLLVGVCVIAVMAWRATVNYPTQVFDLYPLYYGARAWIHGRNAYMLDAVTPIQDHHYSLFLIGNSYPLPAILLTLPLSLLPGKLAAMLWLGGLVAGLLLALRLNRAPYWLLFYFPILNGLNLEQYTVLVLILQLVALWAWREQHMWVLALCCTVILTKPNQSLLFVIGITLLAHNWRRLAVVGAAIWGGSVLLDPRWPGEWVIALLHYNAVSQQHIHWQLALFAIPLLIVRDWVGGMVVLQLLLTPWSLGIYPMNALPLSTLTNSYSRWLVLLSFTWPLAAALVGATWAIIFALILPMVVLATIQHGLPERELVRHLRTKLGATRTMTDFLPGTRRM